MNSKFLKRIVFLTIWSLLVFSINSLAVVSQTSDFYVNDYANVLSEETKNSIMKANIDLQKKTGAQIVVVTVKTLDGKSIEEYATELFREFGIGDSKKNNGVLLLCSTGERQFRIEVGYGLEGKLTDGKTGRIQDEYIIPYLKKNNYDEGIKNGFAAVLKEVADEYDVEIDTDLDLESYSIDEGRSVIEGLIVLIYNYIVFIMIKFVIKRREAQKNICVVFYSCTNYFGF